MKLGSYTVQAAAARAGISTHTLRAWEARYRAVEPERAPSGHRRYGEHDVERLQKIAALVRCGHAVGEVAGLADIALDRLFQTEPQRASRRLPLDASPGIRARADSLMQAIETFDIARVTMHVKWLRAALGVRAFVLGVAVPLFARLGELVAASSLDVCQEHALSAVMRDQLGDMSHSLQALSCGEVPETTVVFAAPEDDLHEFGILLGAALASVHGLGVYYAGANLPAKNLAAAVAAVRAPLVVLGNAPVPATERRIAFADYLAQLDGLLPPTVDLVVGGAGDRPRTSLDSHRTFAYVNALDELDHLLETRSRKG